MKNVGKVWQKGFILKKCGSIMGQWYFREEKKIMKSVAKVLLTPFSDTFAIK